MPGYQGKYILLRFYRRKISAICCFLKTDKLQHPYPFPIHPLPHTRKFQNIRVCKVRFNGTGSIYCLADITEQKRCSFRLFRQPALRKTRQGGCRKFFLQATPNPPRFLFIRYYSKSLVTEQRKRLPFRQQSIRKSTTGIGFKNRSQQSLKCIIEYKQSHFLRLQNQESAACRHISSRVSAPASYVLSAESFH